MADKDYNEHNAYWEQEKNQGWSDFLNARESSSSGAQEWNDYYKAMNGWTPPPLQTSDFEPTAFRDTRQSTFVPPPYHAPIVDTPAPFMSPPPRPVTS